MGNFSTIFCHKNRGEVEGAWGALGLHTPLHKNLYLEGANRPCYVKEDLYSANSSHLSPLNVPWLQSEA